VNEKQGDLLKHFVDSFMKESRVTRNDPVVTGGKGGAMPISLDD
jgi:hypothetical protein